MVSLLLTFQLALVECAEKVTIVYSMEWMKLVVYLTMLYSIPMVPLDVKVNPIRIHQTTSLDVS